MSKARRATIRLDPTRAFTWIVGWLDRDRQSTAAARRRGKFSALQSLENSKNAKGISFLSENPILSFPRSSRSLDHPQ
jgi:hypothetical protein